MMHNFKAQNVLKVNPVCRATFNLIFNDNFLS